MTGDQTIYSEPAISVVLPVLNEAADIGRLLGEVLTQQSPAGGFEVIVADGGSTDDTRRCVTELMTRWDNLVLLDNPGRRSSAGRNVGARAARGKYVMFLDGHCALPRNDYLVRVEEIFADTGAACLCRPQPLNRLLDGEWARAISAARHSRLGHNTGSDIYSDKAAYTDPHSAGAIYTRTVIEDLGGYDERFDACEDVEFNHRIATAGHKAYRHPDLAVAYRPRSSLSDLYRQMFRYGVGRAHLMAKHPATFPLPLLMISLFSLFLLISPLVFDLKVSGLIAALALCCWLGAISAESLRLGKGRPVTVRIIAAFGAIYAGLAIGFWRGLCAWRRFSSG